MRYISTRGDNGPRNFTDVLLAGLAPDGGLYMPETYPRYDLGFLRGKSYNAVAKFIFSVFAPEIPYTVVSRIVDETYTTRAFGSSAIAPVKWLEEGQLGLLQLSNGPTGAFKDMPLQPLARLMDEELRSRAEHRTIVVATSGDTGGATAEAFKDSEYTSVYVLYPHERVSDIQRRQMTTVDRPHIHALAIKGDFDDCQRIVKNLFADGTFAARHQLSGVNSINWARIVAQIAYWIWCYLVAVPRGGPIVVVIPSGNFGNAYAAYVANRMFGGSVQIVIATNVNDVLHTFFSEEIYEKKGEVVPTSSPSMDILVSSNLERLIFDMADRDPSVVVQLYKDFAETGTMNVSSLKVQERSGILSDSTSEESVDRTIGFVERRYGALIDPHTAVAMHVALREMHDFSDRPHIVAETALPFKFPDAIKQAVGFRPPLPERFAHLLKRQEIFEVLPNDTEAVKNYIMAHAR